VSVFPVQGENKKSRNPSADVTGNDVAYFRMCHELGLVKSPFLEVGSARVQGETPNLCVLAREFGTEKVAGVDLSPGNGVDFSFDFSIPSEEFEKKWEHGSYKTVATFNVLEHTFDPITVLRNALHCTADGGTLIVVTPAVWQLHDWPGDYVRFMPHWHETFAFRFGLLLQRNTFCWLSQFGIVKIDDLLDDGRYQLPSFLNSGRRDFPVRYWVSRYAHRIFNTFGRSHTLTHAAVGAAFIKAPKNANT